jgi:hypothetical protein
MPKGRSKTSFIPPVQTRRPRSVLRLAIAVPIVSRYKLRMMNMPRSKKRVKYFCRMAFLWGERDEWRNKVRKKYSSMENMGEAVVVRRGVRRRRTRGRGRRDAAMFPDTDV